MKILLIKRDNIGDLILTTPLIAQLAKKHQVDLLVNSYNKPVLDGNPNVNRVHFYTKFHHRKPGQSKLSILFHRVKTIIDIRCSRYDVAVVCGDRQAFQWAKISGAKRIMAATDHARGNRHLVEWFNILAHSLGINEQPGGLELFVPQANIEQVIRIHGIDQTVPKYGLQISARKEKQRWPEANFIEVAHKLSQREKCEILLFWSPGTSESLGHPGDDAKALKIIEECKDIVLKPIKTKNICELMAAMSLCDQILTSDGGALHIAVGVNKPVVALFGDSNSEIWAPWNVPCRIIQGAKKDVRNVSTNDVYEKFIELRNEVISSVLTVEAIP